MTFGHMSQKLWPNMLLFFPAGQSGQIKKSFVSKKKIEIGFLELYIRGKLLIILFQSISHNL